MLCCVLRSAICDLLLGGGPRVGCCWLLLLDAGCWLRPAVRPPSVAPPEPDSQRRTHTMPLSARACYRALQRTRTTCTAPTMSGRLLLQQRSFLRPSLPLSPALRQQQEQQQLRRRWLSTVAGDEKSTDDAKAPSPEELKAQVEAREKAMEEFKAKMQAEEQAKAEAAAAAEAEAEAEAASASEEQAETWHAEGTKMSRAGDMDAASGACVCVRACRHGHCSHRHQLFLCPDVAC
jgi:hypothetical protein